MIVLMIRNHLLLSKSNGILIFSGYLKLVLGLFLVWAGHEMILLLQNLIDQMSEELPGILAAAAYLASTVKSNTKAI